MKSFEDILKRDSSKLEGLERLICYKYNDKSLLLQALCHSTFINELSNGSCYERLEFLGDSILSFISSDYLYQKYSYQEGQLSKLKSILVSEDSLFQVALHFKLQDYVYVGKSLLCDLKDIETYPKAILADLVESLISSMYLDSSIESSRAFIYSFFEFLINEKKVLEEDRDFKSLLQEMVQYRYKILPLYEINEKDLEDGSKAFEVSVFVKNKLISKSVASNNKEAKRLAAKEAYSILCNKKLSKV